jgi:hypothetical protein
MTEQKSSAPPRRQSVTYPKSRIGLLKFLIVCLPFWLTMLFYNGPYEELVRYYLSGIMRITVVGIIIQMILPSLNERLLLICLFVVFSVLELACMQFPTLFGNVSLVVFDRVVIGSECSQNKIPYYGVGAFICFFMLRACRVKQS